MSYYFYLLAQSDLGGSFRRHSRSSKSLFANKYLILMVVGVAAIWAGLYYWDKWRKKNAAKDNSTADLFNELCVAHKLEKNEKQLLLKASEHHKLNDPALLFVSPNYFSQCPESLESNETLFASLARKLFGDHRSQ